MAHFNLEVFKFGMYVMFPIGWMYYFGTNLDGRFNVPDFWPSADQAHRLPETRDEVDDEVRRIVAVQKRVVARREAVRAREREEMGAAAEAESAGAGAGGSGNGGGLQQQLAQQAQQVSDAGTGAGTGKRWWSW